MHPVLALRRLANSTGRARAQVGDQHGGSGVCEGETETDEETRADEHSAPVYDSSDNQPKSMGSQ